MDIKSVQLTGLKAGVDDGLEEGQFTAYFSTWTREPDSYGDVVAKGAFTETIEAWKSGGNTLPILFGHDLVDPFSNIGGALDIVEDDHGGKVTAQLDLANPKAAQVYRMLKGRRINQMSFAFDVLEDGMVELKAVGDKPARTARELRKMTLHEISVVPFGANATTEILAVKAFTESLKGFSSKSVASLKTARDAIDAVIAAATEEDESKASQAEAEAKAHGREASASSSRSAQMLSITSITANL